MCPHFLPIGMIHTRYMVTIAATLALSILVQEPTICRPKQLVTFQYNIGSYFNNLRIFVWLPIIDSMANFQYLHEKFTYLGLLLLNLYKYLMHIKNCLN